MTDLQAEYRHEDLSIDQQLALRTAAARLAAEFDGTYGPQTIERLLHNWEIDDPAGLDVAGVRPIRDELERRVRALLSPLDLPAGREQA